MKGRSKVAIPHLTGGLNNKLNQLIEFSESLDHPVFLDRQGNHITNHDIVRLYEESQTANDKKPLVYIYHAPNNEELARRNPAKPSKRKTNARDKYMANLLGGKDGNDLLNLASKVGSRKAAVELLKSGNGKSPYNVEIPLTDEDEIQSLKMQGLSPSNNALVDQAYRKKLENQIVSYLGSEEEDLASIDKGVLITDELITDFRQMLTVYHLAHQMNGPVANAIKGHVPRSKSQVFDRLIPSFDDILAGENLVLFANQIIREPRAKYTRFTMPDSTTTLLPPWLDLADPNDTALRELRDSLGDRDVETFLQLLAGGDLFGAIQKIGSNISNAFEVPFNLLFGIRRIRQDDRQARMFDDLIENIADALVADFGRGRGYTNRKELAKAIVFATEDAYDKRITDVFSPLRVTVNAARRVRRFSPSGATMKLALDFQTLDAGEIENRPSVGQITPGMFYIGNFDFQIPPIGWNRKWMVATAQIIHEYWPYIRPSGASAANAAFMPLTDDRSLSLPQILYLIAIRAKELYNYDLAPEEWLVLIHVLGGENALKENFYSRSNQGYTSEIDSLIYQIEEEIIQQRAELERAVEASRIAGVRRNPSNSALPQVYSKNLMTLEKALKTRTSILKSQLDEMKNIRRKTIETDKKTLDKLSDEVKSEITKRKTFEVKLKEAMKTTDDVGKELAKLEKDAARLEKAMEALEKEGGKTYIVDEIGASLTRSLEKNALVIGVDALRNLANDLGIPFEEGTKKEQLHGIIMNHIKGVKTEDTEESAKVLKAVSETVIEPAKEKVEDLVEEIADDSDAILEAAMESVAAIESSRPPKGVARRKKKAYSEPEEEAKDPPKDAGDTPELPELPKDSNYASKKNDPKWKPDKSYFDRVDKFIDGLGDDRDTYQTIKQASVPKSPKPTVYLGDTGKIVILGDTHADYLINQALFVHIMSNYKDAKHVVWLGDTVDGGRAGATNMRDEWVPFDHDMKNLEFINDLVKEDPKKYIPLQGNHERPSLAPSFITRYDQSQFWNEALDTKGFKWTITKELKDFSIRPAIAVAGRTIMMHGQFPDSPLNLKEIKNDNKLGNKKLADVLWNRRDFSGKRKSFDDEWVKHLTDLGLNTQIVAHTPSIASVYLREIKSKNANENGMFYDKDGLLGASLQSSCMPAYSDNTEYFVLDLDNDELIIEEFDKKGQHVKTLRQKTPPQKSGSMAVDDLEIGRRNPAGDYHKYEKKVISILKKEGGAAGLTALKPAFPKKTTKAKARSMLKKMNHVVQHQDGDYILVRGISNPMDYAVRAEESIKGTKIQTSPGPKGANCGSCIYMCPTSGRCSKWSEMAGRPVFVLEDWYCKAYEARPKMNKPIGAIELGVGVSLLGGIAVIGKFAGPYVSHLLAKRREKKLSEKIVGDVVGELKPLIESLGQRNEEAVAYSVAKQMTPSQIEQLGELQDEIGDEIEPEVEEFFDEIIEQSEVQVRYHIIETPHGEYRYDEDRMTMEVPVGDDDKVMSWIENNMQEDNPNLYHDVTIEGDTATYKLKKKARRNVPFDLSAIESANQRDALDQVEVWAEKYIDDELRHRVYGLQAEGMTSTGNLNYEITIKGEGNDALLRILQLLAPTAWPNTTEGLPYIDSPQRFTNAQRSAQRSSLHKVATELGKLYRDKETNKPASVKVSVQERNRYFIVEFTSASSVASRKTERKRPKRRKPKMKIGDAPTKNPQLPACSYRKSKRAKACGGKLRAKKNPKGRIVCTKCDAEYEMR